MDKTKHVDWIAVDWGTSFLRVNAIDRFGKIIAQKKSDQGMGVLEPSGYEAALLDLISPWLRAGTTLNVMCCGMVGARQGWQETAYRTVPCTPTKPDELMHIPTDDRRIYVRVAPGIQQFSPADVMRGEETQIAGYLGDNQNFDGIICLPGTHSKWAKISSRQIISFHSCMTGEVFSLLATQSVLRHSVAPDGWSSEDFARGVQLARDDPAKICTKLFGVRAEQLLNDLPAVSARAYLSGMLIGQEIMALRDYWNGQPIVVIGAGDLADRYRSAFELLGVCVELVDVTAATLAGLSQHNKGE